MEIEMIADEERFREVFLTGANGQPMEVRANHPINEPRPLIIAHTVTIEERPVASQEVEIGDDMQARWSVKYD